MTDESTFVHLTSTAWTAVASIISAVSLVALTVFNVLYLKAARTQATAASDQAAAANKALTEAQASNKLAQEAIQAQQRPWVGLDDSTPIIVGPIKFDMNGTATVTYAIPIKNYGDTPAQGILTFAQLMITEDIADITLEEQRVCRPNQDRSIGIVLFPGGASSTMSGSSFPSARMKSKTYDHMFTAWLIGSVRYSDRYGNHYHTSFRYWMVDKDARMNSYRFHASPNTELPPMPFEPNGVGGSIA